jgi:DNA recombination protein RmuC
MEAAVLILLMLVLIAGVFWLIVVVSRGRAEPGTDPSLLQGLQHVAQTESSLLQGLQNVSLQVNELQAYTRARHDLERQTTDSIRRLETIIAGTQSKGAAGENIIEYAFSKLPPTWQVRNFTVGNKRVEFGLRLASNLVLPIDSKWPATGLVEQFAVCRDVDEQRRLKHDINRAVLEKAREVQQYLSPNITTRFGIAAVPDAVYDLSPYTQVEAMKIGVVVISYSMLLPYLMLVFETMLQSTQRVDLERLDACLDAAQQCTQSMQEELEGRFARAVTMLANSRNDLSASLGKVSSALASVQRVG